MRERVRERKKRKKKKKPKEPPRSFTDENPSPPQSSQTIHQNPTQQTTTRTPTPIGSVDPISPSNTPETSHQSQTCQATSPEAELNRSATSASDVGDANTRLASTKYPARNYSTWNEIDGNIEIRPSTNPEIEIHQSNNRVAIKPRFSLSDNPPRQQDETSSPSPSTPFAQQSQLLRARYFDSDGVCEPKNDNEESKHCYPWRSAEADGAREPRKRLAQLPNSKPQQQLPLKAVLVNRRLDRGPDPAFLESRRSGPNQNVTNALLARRSAAKASQPIISQTRRAGSIAAKGNQDDRSQPGT